MPLGDEAQVLDGTVRAGRYNRPGQRTLYMSGSPEGVAAAMARYGPAPRAIVRLQVSATDLIDLRDADECAAAAIDPARVKEDWIAALNRGETPPSWLVADAARGLGATGLIDRSSRLPGAWHLILFEWGADSRVMIRVRG